MDDNAIPPLKLRAVVQRVSRATVYADGMPRGSIANGLLVLFGVGWAAGNVRGVERRYDEYKVQKKPFSRHASAVTDVSKLIEKLLCLRTFPDADRKMNLSLQEINGGVALVSQFTLFADLRKGTRPGFQEAAPPDLARFVYDEMCSRLSEALCADRFVSGVFGADMAIDFVNNGPVTYVIDVQDGRVLGGR